MYTDFEFKDSGWDKIIHDAASMNSPELRVVCPFIKKRSILRLLAGKKPKTIKVITRFNLREMYDGVSDADALHFLLNNGAKVRGIKNLHAKLYLFGDRLAVVTSANLTEAALSKNHEFGFVSGDKEIITRCREYFDNLWAQAGQDLEQGILEDWKQHIEAQCTFRANSLNSSGLSDEGIDVGLTPQIMSAQARLAEPFQSFVKFLGISKDRVSWNWNVLEAVKSSGCHWACTYPKNKRPRKVMDGDLIFIGHFVKDPNDIAIYGRATALRHIPGRDEASEEDIKLRPWKARWPNYIRVHHAEFISGSLINGIKLSAMLDELRADAFMSTQANSDLNSDKAALYRAIRRQPAMQLTDTARNWLNCQFDNALVTHGRLIPAEMKTLDWPGIAIDV